jgi:hypothetical protein
MLNRAASRAPMVTTGRMNERDHPNIVEVPVPSSGFRETSFQFDAFP